MRRNRGLVELYSVLFRLPFSVCPRSFDFGSNRMSVRMTSRRISAVFMVALASVAKASSEPERYTSAFHRVARQLTPAFALATP